MCVDCLGGIDVKFKILKRECTFGSGEEKTGFFCCPELSNFVVKPESF